MLNKMDKLFFFFFFSKMGYVKGVWGKYLCVKRKLPKSGLLSRPLI